MLPCPHLQATEKISWLGCPAHKALQVMWEGGLPGRRADQAHQRSPLACMPDAWQTAQHIPPAVPAPAPPWRTCMRMPLPQHAAPRPSIQCRQHQDILT